MAKSKKADESDLPLFADLPLRPVEDGSAGLEAERPPPQPPDQDPPAVAAETPSEAPAVSEAAAQTNLFSDPDDAPAAELERLESPAETTAPALGERLRGGIADLAVQLLMLAVAVTAAYRLGVSVTIDYWPPFAVLALVFSFLYWVVPLAFWGQTPGMAWVGHLARGMDDGPLTFGQTFRRWIGALLTLSLAGLPLLLVLAGRSLSDRISGSKSVRLQP